MLKLKTKNLKGLIWLAGCKPEQRTGTPFSNDVSVWVVHHSFEFLPNGTAYDFQNVKV